MFVLPRMTAPTSRSRSVMWASYGATYPSRMREPAVHWPPLTETRSLSPTGMPSSGWSAGQLGGPGASRVGQPGVGRVRLGRGHASRSIDQPGVQRPVARLGGVEGGRR